MREENSLVSLKIANEENINQFDKDIISNKGYLYTIKSYKSSRLANERLTNITKSTIGKIKGKKVIDVGCGDGTYTSKLYKWGKPKMMVGIDASKEAITLAQKRYGKKEEHLTFRHSSCYKIPYHQQYFDIAIARGLLHHLDDPILGLSKIAEIANQVFIIEPNGYNPILKLMEKLSSYHRGHDEKSYAPITIRRWIKNLDRKIIKESYAGLVPFFCPDWMADLLKTIEPWIEKTPIMRNFSCAVYIVFLTHEPRAKS